MIRMIQSNSAAHAKAYFSDALQKSDYYIDAQELSGEIQGRIAERLNLSGKVTREVFFALCDNKNPNSGERLTQRNKQERITGYDINFHCPKSVSIVHALSKDNHIQKAFEASVQDTMLDIQEDAKTRVRKNRQYADRTTKELIWADFTHQTARPVENALPDPHLHSHCFVFNVTWDNEEKQFKAGRFRDIKRDMPYYQACFHKRLADRLANLGYKIKATDKSFELEGVPRRVINLFSKRTDEIDRIAEEKDITDAREKSELGAKTRARKQKGLSMDELKASWKQQIKSLENIEEESQNAVRFALQKEKKSFTAHHCVEYSLQHCFERASVVSDRRILETAYHFSLGNESVSLDSIKNYLKAHDKVIQVKDANKTLCTTHEVFAEEKRMIDLVRHGQNKFIPLYDRVPNLKAKGQQADAIKHILTSPHRVNIVRGAAGTGKTQLMKEAIEMIESRNKKVTVIAPTANASRDVLRDEGFLKAETVAKFLSDPKLQNMTDNNVLWVDEAGLLGTKDMAALLEIVTKKKARLILSGDTRQHASVVRGDALRILNTVAKVPVAELTEIRRQKSDFFKLAVTDLSKGDIANGFLKLDAMNFIQEINPLNPNKQLVDDYVESLSKGRSALVVSPTHKQGEEVTNEIRQKLRNKGMIGKKQIKALRLKNLNLTAAQKSDWRNFKQGLVIQFNQNKKGIKRGSAWSVKSVAEPFIEISNEQGQIKKFHLDKANSYDVYEPLEVELAKGDKIQITRNGFDIDKRRLNNGQILNVQSVSKSGKIKLKNQESKIVYSVKHDFGHINHAHVITSHAAQGKTVDDVFISQPAATFPATDAKQFYVSVSRARDKATIYTDDKTMLLDHAKDLRERQSAVELMNRHEQIVRQSTINKQYYTKDIGRTSKQNTTMSRRKEREYEPGV